MLLRRQISAAKIYLCHFHAGGNWNYGTDDWEDGWVGWEKKKPTAQSQEIPMLKGEVGGKLGEHCIMKATRRREWSTISNGIASLRNLVTFKVLD